jgi:hypothetical protein
VPSLLTPATPADDKRKAPDKKIFQLHDEAEAPSIKEQYAWLIDGAVESVLDEPDEEILAELEGPTGPEEAELLRAMKFSLARLLDTEEGRRRKQELDRELEEIGERLYEIPPTPEERKALLDEILEKVPPLRQEIPGPSREVDELSDGDVRRVLRRLAPLGDLYFYLDVGSPGHWSEDVSGDDDGVDLGVVEDPREPLRAGTYSGPSATGGP